VILLGRHPSLGRQLYDKLNKSRMVQSCVQHANAAGVVHVLPRGAARAWQKELCVVEKVEEVGSELRVHASRKDKGAEINSAWASPKTSLFAEQTTTVLSRLAVHNYNIRQLKYWVAPGRLAG
jgi:hypothetical protein